MRRSKNILHGFVTPLTLSIGLLISWLLFRSRQTAAALPMANGLTTLGTKTLPTVVYNSFDLLATDAYTRKLWTAISALETGYWMANIYRQTNNLFSIHFTSRDNFAVGSIPGDGGFVATYSNTSDAVKALNAYFIRLNWTKTSFSSMQELVSYMSTKNYFTSDPTAYLQGAMAAYKNLYG